jgi:hypothetical protein
MLTVQDGKRVVAKICPECQKAKKIQITLEKTEKGWKFFQYFPVEA